MAGEIVSQLIIPRCEGRAFELQRGQTLRVIAVEGKQVGDMTLLNLTDFRERLNIPITSSSNGRSLFSARELYSGPPHFNVMLTVTGDRHRMHWLHGRCTSLMYRRLYGVEGHRNCHDNIVESLRPFGIQPHDVPFDTFNIFMVAAIDAEGRYSFKPPLVEKGDFIEFRAEMDLLVSISACPDEGEINDYEAKPLKVEARE